jgi:Flp pilus assembly CpaF family ATPase
MTPRSPDEQLVKDAAATDEGPAAQDIRAFVSWRVGKTTNRRALGDGRHLIGDSAFATVRLGTGGGQTIAAALTVDAKAMTLKCLSAALPIFVDGRKLVPGELVLVGDILEMTIGRVPVTIAARVVSARRDHVAAAEDGEARRRAQALRSGSGAAQAEADEAFADPDRFRSFLSRRLLDALDMRDVDLASVDSPEVREAARLKLRKLVTDLIFPEGFPFTKDQIEQQVFDEVMGLGPLEPLLADPTVTEIMVNRRDQIYVERSGKLTLSAVSFSSDQALMNVIERIVSTVGRRIDTSSPVVDARLLDGSRVNAVIPPLAIKGPCLTIRRFSRTPIRVDQLVGWGSMTQTMADLLRLVVEGHKNVIVSGGTGSGKTTLLNALSSFIPNGERICTVEDAAELQLQQDHVISLESRPPNLEGVGAITIRDLVKNTLRMRPDRIIVGECRGAEALDMLQAMNTGHDGSMTTAHANAPEDMLRRLETMVLMAGVDLPLRAIREQISSALTVIVQQTRRKNGRRLVTEIAWIRALDRASGEYQVTPLVWRDAKDEVVVDQAALKSFWSEEEMSGELDALLKGVSTAKASKGKKS